MKAGFLLLYRNPASIYLIRRDSYCCTGSRVWQSFTPIFYVIFHQTLYVPHVNEYVGTMRENIDERLKLLYRELVGVLWATCRQEINVLPTSSPRVVNNFPSPQFLSVSPIYFPTNCQQISIFSSHSPLHNQCSFHLRHFVNTSSSKN